MQIVRHLCRRRSGLRRSGRQDADSGTKGLGKPKKDNQTPSRWSNDRFGLKSRPWLPGVPPPRIIGAGGGLPGVVAWNAVLERYVFLCPATPLLSRRRTSARWRGFLCPFTGRPVRSWRLPAALEGASGSFPGLPLSGLPDFFFITSWCPVRLFFCTALYINM